MAAHAPHKQQQAMIEPRASFNKEPVFGRLTWRNNLSLPNGGLDCIPTVNADRAEGIENGMSCPQAAGLLMRWTVDGSTPN
jgi:hypothetical protein